MSGRCKKIQTQDKIPNNNINININFRVQQKPVLVGRKIDNSVEVHKIKGQKLDAQRPHYTEQFLQLRKKQLDRDKQDELRKNKQKKVIRQKSQNFQKRQKTGKSLEISRPFRDSTPQTSNSKSRSNSNSKKKLMNNKKDIKVFQNPGIKKKFAINNLKSPSQKIFMNDNIKEQIKTKQKIKKKLKGVNGKIQNKKPEKTKTQLKTLEKQRKLSSEKKKDNRNQKQRIKSSSMKRFPLFNLDDENFDQQKQYSRLRKEAQQLIHAEESHFQRLRQKSQKKLFKNTQKKHIKPIERFYKNNPTNNDQKILNQAALVIQKNWRGFFIRSLYANELNIMNQKVQIKRNKIKLKNSNFWNSESNNSIYRIQHFPISSSQNFPCLTISDSDEEEAKKDQSKLSLENQKINQVLQLKRILFEQSQKYRMLQEQNLKLKQNINFQSEGQQSIKEKLEWSGLQTISVPLPKQQKSSQDHQINKEKEDNQEKIKITTYFQMKKKQLQLQTDNVDTLKRIMEAYQSSPRQQISLSRIKGPYVNELFHNKQLKLQKSFNKKSQMFQRMLNDRLVSPRTYKNRVALLEKGFRKQKAEIHAKLEEAKRVSQYIVTLEQEELNEDPFLIENQKEQQKNEINLNEEKNQNKQNSKFSQLQIPKLEPSEEIDEQLVQQNDKTYKNYKQINEDRGIESSQSQGEHSQGFQTNLTFIKEYCIGLCEYIRSIDYHRRQFAHVLSTPIQYNKIQFMKSYRMTINAEHNNNYNCHRHNYLYPFFKIITAKKHAISRQMYDQFNQVYDRLTQKEDLKVWQSYYLQCLFDAFNQSLDYQRPGGVYGIPMGWNQNSKYLKNHFNLKYQSIVDQMVKQQKLDQFFGMSIARVIQWGSSLCGFIAQSLQLQKNQSVQFTQEQIQHVRQNRMALMLQKAIIEDQQKIINSQLEETQVKLAISQYIVQKTIIQLLRDITSIFNQ